MKLGFKPDLKAGKPKYNNLPYLLLIGIIASFILASYTSDEMKGFPSATLKNSGQTELDAKQPSHYELYVINSKKSTEISISKLTVMSSAGEIIEINKKRMGARRLDERAGGGDKPAQIKNTAVLLGEFDSLEPDVYTVTVRFDPAMKSIMSDKKPHFGVVRSNLERNDVLHNLSVAVGIITVFVTALLAIMILIQRKKFDKSIDETTGDDEQPSVIPPSRWG